jgi:hypothetical protein
MGGSHQTLEHMDDTHTKPLQERTAAKLRYARIHLDELKSHGPPDGGDFDKAHQESFLFHLLGTRDALLVELNHYYAAGVPSDALSLGKIRDALKVRGISSPELRKLYELEQNESSWLAKAKDMRDHSTHVQGVPRAYFLGGENHQKVKLKHPRTGDLTERHFTLEFEDWLNSMSALVVSLRESGLSNRIYNSAAGE